MFQQHATRVFFSESQLDFSHRWFGRQTAETLVVSTAATDRDVDDLKHRNARACRRVATSLTDWDESDGHDGGVWWRVWLRALRLGLCSCQRYVDSLTIRSSRPELNHSVNATFCIGQLNWLSVSDYIYIAPTTIVSSRLCSLVCLFLPVFAGKNTAARLQLSACNFRINQHWTGSMIIPNGFTIVTIHFSTVYITAAKM